jgi:hypothetical protein
VSENSQSVPPATSQVALLQVDQTGRPLVDVWTTGPTASVVSQLEALEATIVSTSDPYHLVEAWMDVTDLPVIATMVGVLSLTPVYKPITYVGSVRNRSHPGK